MSAQVLRTDPPSRKQLREIVRMVEEGVAPLVELAGRAGAPVRCVVSGGTTGALARILAARRWGTPPASLNQWSVGLDEVRELGRSSRRSTSMGG
jgi:exopolyphosphatase/pppGpp-phosphohydrolase